MTITFAVENEGQKFEYVCVSDSEGIRFYVDNQRIHVGPIDFHELGLLMKRQASFCKQYAKSDMLSEFEDNWYVDHNAESKHSAKTKNKLPGPNW